MQGRSPEITARAVRVLFQTVLRGNDRAPTLGPCREVAAWLQYLRLRRARPAAARSGGSPQAGKAAATLLDTLRTLETAYAKFPAGATKVPALPFLEEVISERAAIAADIRTARQTLERLRPVLAVPAKDGPPWHAEAEGLFRIFLAAMEQANPGRRFEPSNDGPAVRFIRAALLLAVGEERREGTIAQHLKRRRRRGTGRGVRRSRDNV